MAVREKAVPKNHNHNLYIDRVISQ